MCFKTPEFQSKCIELQDMNYKTTEKFIMLLIKWVPTFC